MDVFDRALKAFCDTLADESGGGGGEIFPAPWTPGRLQARPCF